MGSVPKLTNYERTMSLGELCHYSLQEPSNILVSPSAVSDAANQPTFQCVVVGDPDVDKTLLLLSYVGSKVLGEDDYVPLVFHSCEKSVSIGNKTYRLLLKDTSGQENYDRLHAVNYVQTDVFLVCFSVIQPSTFDNIKTKWVPEIRQNCPQTPFILVGTQVDRRDDPTIVESLLKEHLKPTTAKDGEVLAKKLKAYKYLECSVVTRQGVEEVFTEAVEACRKGKRLSWGQQLIGKIRPK
jgi:cell division control protein 42